MAKKKKKGGKINLMPNPANLSHKKPQKIKIILSVKLKVRDKILSWYSHTANNPQDSGANQFMPVEYLILLI